MYKTKLLKRPIIRSPASMSTYFPRGTHYFYSYPAGEASGFFNKVSPTIEELVAARTLSCAGPKVAVVSFASTAEPEIDGRLLDIFAIPQVDPNLLTILPKDIGIDFHGKERNEAIMAALAKSVAPGSLIMAQPFTSKKVEALYQIPPSLTTWLNDKSNMTNYIDASLLPKRFAGYASGAEFANDVAWLCEMDILPCVIKVSSSSSGDGVYICATYGEVKQASNEIQSVTGSIFVEQFVEPLKNYAIHFGVPHDNTKAIDIVGFNEQVTSDEGEFLGGIIDSKEFPPALKEAKNHIQEDILPKIRNMGWYGIGGFDVIISGNGHAYIIDCNFRMTGMSAYHFLVANGKIKKPMISFGGQFNGSRKEFEKTLLPFASKSSPNKCLQLIALSRHNNQWDFNGALMYKDVGSLNSIILRLLRAGVKSPALEKFID